MYAHGMLARHTKRQEVSYVELVGSSRGSTRLGCDACDG